MPKLRASSFDHSQLLQFCTCVHPLPLHALPLIYFMLELPQPTESKGVCELETKHMLSRRVCGWWTGYHTPVDGTMGTACSVGVCVGFPKQIQRKPWLSVTGAVVDTGYPAMPSGLISLGFPCGCCGLLSPSGESQDDVNLLTIYFDDCQINSTHAHCLVFLSGFLCVRQSLCNISTLSDNMSFSPDLLSMEGQN